MELLEIREFSRMDGRRLMDLYGESNAENADFFYPDTVGHDLLDESVNERSFTMEYRAKERSE